MKIVHQMPVPCLGRFSILVLRDILHFSYEMFPLYWVFQKIVPHSCSYCGGAVHSVKSILMHLDRSSFKLQENAKLVVASNTALLLFSNNVNIK